MARTRQTRTFQRIELTIRNLSEDQIQQILATDDPAIIKEILNKPHIQDQTALAYKRNIQNVRLIEHIPQRAGPLAREAIPRVQGVLTRIEELERENQRLREENERLQQQMNELQQRIERLEQQQREQPQQPQPTQPAQQDDLTFAEINYDLIEEPVTDYDEIDDILYDEPEQGIRINETEQYIKYESLDLNVNKISRAIRENEGQPNRIGVKIEFVDETGRFYSSYNVIDTNNLLVDLSDYIIEQESRYGSRGRTMTIYSF